MNKQILFIPGLFALGILTGIFMMKSRQQDTTDTIMPAPAVETTREVAAASPFDVVVHNDELAQLQERLDALTARIEVLERDAEGDEFPPMEPDRRDSGDTTSIDTPVTAQARVLSSDTLITAGVDAVIAEEFIRRKNALELKKLELRDAAIRGGYLNQKRYRDELQSLLDQDISIRDELGDEVYDRYLYHNGEANRVRVASVMLSSAAEMSGIRDGDLILAYDEQRLFDWDELQRATTQGNRGEYVSVTIQRDGEQSILWVPRGPLGVRLTTTRLDPDR